MIPYPTNVLAGAVYPLGKSDPLEKSNGPAPEWKRQPSAKTDRRAPLAVVMAFANGLSVGRLFVVGIAACVFAACCAAQTPRNAREAAEQMADDPAQMAGEPGGAGYEDDMGMEGYDEEMMGMDGYDEEMMNMDGYGYGGARGGDSSRNLLAAQLASVSSALESVNLMSLADPNAAPPVASGPVLLNEATVAYSKGHHPLAMQLFFGHIVAEFDNAAAAAQMVKYSRLMKRPAWQVRWGISFAVRGDATDPQPIPDVAPRETNPGNALAMGGGPGMDESMGMGMDEQMEMEMQDEGLAMEMQMEQEMAMGMEEEMGMGMYGRRDRQKEAPAAPPTPGERLAAIDRGMLSEEVKTQLTDTMGVLATVIGEQFDKRYSKGDFGRALTDVTPESGSPETVSAGFVDLIETGADPLPLWRPGLVFVGRGDSDQTVVTARKAGLDLLIHVDVLLKPLRGEYVQNIARCRLFHVPSGKSMGISKSVDSLEFAQQSRAKGLGSREYVDEQLANFWGIVDRETLTSELPSLTPDVARRRVGSLLASGGGKNLRTLAEVRLFQQQQLLSEDEVVTAFDIVGGEEALELIYGSEDRKLELVRKWAGDAIGMPSE